MRTTRVDTGSYSVQNDEGDSVSVWEVQDGPPCSDVHWWIACADWDEKLFVGPLPKKAQAVYHAKLMLLAKSV